MIEVISNSLGQDMLIRESDFVDLEETHKLGKMKLIINGMPDQHILTQLRLNDVIDKLIIYTNDLSSAKQVKGVIPIGYRFEFDDAQSIETQRTNAIKQTADLALNRSCDGIYCPMTLISGRLVKTAHSYDMWVHTGKAQLPADIVRCAVRDVDAIYSDNDQAEQILRNHMINELF